jgi:hypothetical protein
VRNVNTTGRGVGDGGPDSIAADAADADPAGSDPAETDPAGTQPVAADAAEDGAEVRERPSPARRTDFVQSLDRGLAVIRCFSSERPSLTLSEVAERTGLTRRNLAT